MKLKFKKLRIPEVKVPVVLQEVEVEANFEHELKVIDNMCWLCGKSNQQIHQEKPKNQMTEHHSIPQRYKPKKNVVVPVCVRCHQDKINKVDFGAIVSMAYKIKAVTGKMVNRVNAYLREKDNKNRNGSYKG